MLTSDRETKQTESESTVCDYWQVVEISKNNNAIVAKLVPTFVDTGEWRVVTLLLAKALSLKDRDLTKVI